MPPRPFYILMIRRGEQRNYYGEKICPLHLPITEWDEFQIIKVIDIQRNQKDLTPSFILFQHVWRAHRKYRVYAIRNLRNREITGYQRAFVLSEWLPKEERNH